MKIKLITMGLILGSFSSFAQVTITSGTFQPSPNETFGYKNITSTVTPGAAGSNITWDFTGVTSGNTLNYYVASCNGSGDCANYPGASYYIGNTGLGSKTFYINNTTGLQLNGVDANGSTTFYSDPQMVLKFPATYNQTFTDNFAYNATVSGGTQRSSGTSNAKVDGYGTLKTPSGTYTGVLRVKSDMNQVTWTKVGADSFMNTQITQTYAWYQPGTAHELMNITTVTLTTQGVSTGNTVAYYSGSGSSVTAVNNVNNPLAGIKIFPNPAQGTFKISLVDDVKNIIVRDLLGKTVFSEKISTLDYKNKSIDVNTSGWSKGIYLVEAFAGPGMSTVQKIVVE